MSPLISMTKTVSALIQCHSRVGRRWRYAIRRGGGAGGAASIGSSMTAASFIARNDHSSRQPARQRALLQPQIDNAGDPRACMPIAKRKCWPRHRQTLEWILEKPSDLGDDSVGRGADQTCVTTSNALRPLSLL